MKKLILAVAALTLSGGVLANTVNRDGHARNVPIFVDKTTGFTFVKLNNTKWTFVKQMEGQKMKKVPASYKVAPTYRKS